MYAYVDQSNTGVTITSRNEHSRFVCARNERICRKLAIDGIFEMLEHVDATFDKRLRREADVTRDSFAFCPFVFGNHCSPKRSRRDRRNSPHGRYDRV